MESFKYNEIKITKFSNKKSSKLKCAVLILPGLPGSFKEGKFIKSQKEKIFAGFDVFYLTYPGYPLNQKSVFLEKNLIKLINNFILYLRKNKRYEKIYAIGSSFGASVVLYLNNVDKIISIAPVIDWKNLYKKTDKQNYETLKEYLIKNKYRISNKGWRLLKTGKLFKKPTKNLLKNKPALFIYGNNDREIDLENLKKLIHSLKTNFWEIQTSEHLSLRKLPSSTTERISLMLKKDWFDSYNEKYFMETQRKILKLRKSKKFNFIKYVGVTGSLSLKCATAFSDIDLIFISTNISTEKDKRDLKKIFKNIHNKQGEIFILKEENALEYFTKNIRGCFKFILLEHLYINNLSSNLQSLFSSKKKFIAEYKFLLLTFSLLEFLRLYKFYKKSDDFLTIQRHNINSPGTIKWMIISYGILKNFSDFKFSSIANNLTEDSIISQEEKELLEKFFIDFGLGTKENYKKFIEVNKKIRGIVYRYIEFLLKKIQDYYRCKIYFQTKTLSLILTKKSRIKYFNDIFASLYPSSSKTLKEIYQRYKTDNSLVGNIILYFLSCNKSLPKTVAKSIASTRYNVSLNNIKRNLIEYNRFKDDKEILNLLSSSSDNKTKYFIKLAKKDKTSLNRVRRF